MSDFSQIDNVWLLISSSWWENRDECLSHYWNSIRLIKDDLMYCMEKKDGCVVEVVEEKKTPEKTENKLIAAVQSIDFDFVMPTELCF